MFFPNPNPYTLRPCSQLFAPKPRLPQLTYASMPMTFGFTAYPFHSQLRSAVSWAFQNVLCYVAPYYRRYVEIVRILVITSEKYRSTKLLDLICLRLKFDAFYMGTFVNAVKDTAYLCIAAQSSSSRAPRKSCETEAWWHLLSSVSDTNPDKSDIIQRKCRKWYSIGLFQAA